MGSRVQCSAPKDDFGLGFSDILKLTQDVDTLGLKKAAMTSTARAAPPPACQWQCPPPPLVPPVTMLINRALKLAELDPTQTQRYPSMGLTRLIHNKRSTNIMHH